MKAKFLSRFFIINLILAAIVIAMQLFWGLNSFIFLIFLIPGIIGIVTFILYNAHWFLKSRGTLVRFFIVKSINILLNILFVLLLFLTIKDDKKLILFIYLISYLVNLYLFTYYIAKLNKSENK